MQRCYMNKCFLGIQWANAPDKHHDLCYGGFFYDENNDVLAETIYKGTYEKVLETLEEIRDGFKRSSTPYYCMYVESIAMNTVKSYLTNKITDAPMLYSLERADLMSPPCIKPSKMAYICNVLETTDIPIENLTAGTPLEDLRDILWYGIK